ncbi:MAG: ABC transporter substrate-binding protein [Oscillospiraceae bacterium]|nr:ABC transporter substrate-binding protein [Oscillospiraceae bacterium]
MKLRIPRLVSALAALALVLSLSACAPAAQQEQGLEKITFVLDWTPNTNHTGLYVALSKGYFEQAGLEVEVVQPPQDGAEVLVGSGKAQFGVSFQDYLAPALSGQAPLPITAVAAVIQHNTSGIISRAGEGMDRPAGLAGHKYATWDLPVEKATMAHVMAADGGSFDDVTLIPSTVTDEVSALQSRSVDAIWIFYAWAGIACEVAGLETDYFAFADIDPVFDFYTPVIIANNDYLAQNPDTARAFLSALSQGYTYAIQNPDEAADILMAAAPELGSNETLVRESQRYLADQYTAEAPRWGEFDPQRWSAFFHWLAENDLLEGELAPQAGFTNDYLPAP